MGLFNRVVTTVTGAVVILLLFLWYSLWIEIDPEMLISEIQTFQAFWDMSNPDYGNVDNSHLLAVVGL